MSGEALILVDLQNDYFTGGRCELVGIDAAASNAALVLADFRKRGLRVIHIRHEYNRPDAPYFLAGTKGAEINPSVAPRANETVVLKHRPNSFHNTPLKVILDEHGIDQLTIVGAMSHICIDATVRAAVDFGYAVTLIHDAVATRDLDFGGVRTPAAQVHAAYMAALATAYATVIPAREALTA